MIIKDIPRHNESKSLIEYLMRYCARDTKRSRSFTKEQKDNARILHLHNIRGKSINDIIQAFADNAERRVKKRKNMVVAYHTILSFSPKSTPFLDDKKMRMLAKEYVRLRGENTIYGFFIHEETRHKHLHVAQGGATLDGLKASRISKRQYAELKQKLSDFQKCRFPELSDSLPQHGIAKSAKQFTAEEKAAWINRLPSQKKHVAQTIQDALKKDTSMDEFLTTLKENHIEPYYRAGKLTGISLPNKKKLRLTTIRLEAEIRELEERSRAQEEQLMEIAGIRKKKQEREKHRHDIAPELGLFRESEYADAFQGAQQLQEKFADDVPGAIQPCDPCLHGELQSG